MHTVSIGIKKKQKYSQNMQLKLITGPLPFIPNIPTFPFIPILFWLIYLREAYYSYICSVHLAAPCMFQVCHAVNQVPLPALLMPQAASAAHHVLAAALAALLGQPNATTYPTASYQRPRPCHRLTASSVNSTDPRLSRVAPPSDHD